MQGELLGIWRRSPKTVIFVTHDVQEAVYLADRVAVMTARPGRIKTIVDIAARQERSRHCQVQGLHRHRGRDLGAWCATRPSRRRRRAFRREARLVRYLAAPAAGRRLGARGAPRARVALALPPLSDVVVAWVDMVRAASLSATAPPRSGAQAPGLSLAIVIGAALGIAMAWWRPVNAALGPLVEMFYPMPKSALIPVTVLWLGFGDGSKILLIFLGCMLPVTHRRLQRRARQRPGAGLVGAQHGRQPAAHAVGRRAAERLAGDAQRHPHRAGARLHPPGQLRADRGARRASAI